MQESRDREMYDTGKVGCKSGEMPDLRDARKEGCSRRMTRVQKEGMHERRDSTDEGYMKGGIQEMKVLKWRELEKTTILI